MDKQPYILETKGLSIGYQSGRKKEVLFSKLNLCAEEGKLICLLGENGIGKTTLLRTLANLQPALAGTILINNDNLKHLNAHEIARKISLVLTQSPHGINFTVKELVSLGRFPYTSWSGKLQEHDLQKVEEAMEMCEIIDYGNKNIYQVSDGQFQKALIARALAQDCPLMILDEPTVHLDANNRYIIMKLLKRIASENNKTIIMSTHQISMAAALADIIWLAKPSNELLTATPEKLLHDNVLQTIFPFVKY